MAVGGETGETLAQALESGVSLNTERSHLKRVFAKTGMRRQAELVRLTTMASVLRAP